MTDFWQTLLSQISVVTIAGFILKEVFSNMLDRQSKRLEAKISLKNQHRLNVKQLELEAIIDYDKKISYWILSLFRYNLFNYDMSSYTSIKKDVKSISDLKKDIVFSDSFLDVFITSKDFKDVKDKLTSLSAEYENWVKTTTNELYDLISEYAEEYESGIINIYDEESDTRFRNALNSSVEKFKERKKEEYTTMRADGKTLYNKYKVAVNNLITNIDERRLDDHI